MFSRRCATEGPAEREVRRERDALPLAPVDKLVVLAVGQVVAVLHGDHRGDALRLGELGRGDAAEPEVADEPGR
jgi:hypothetical protein